MEFKIINYLYAYFKTKSVSLSAEVYLKTRDEFAQDDTSNDSLIHE